jgi:hypothetical protein
MRRHKERSDDDKVPMPKPLNLELQKMTNGHPPLDKDNGWYI